MKKLRYYLLYIGQIIGNKMANSLQNKLQITSRAYRILFIIFLEWTVGGMLKHIVLDTLGYFWIFTKDLGEKGCGVSIYN